MVHPSYQEIAHAIRRRERWRDEEPLRFPALGAALYFLSVESGHGDVLLGRPGYRCPEHGLDFAGEPTEDAPTDAAIGENLRFRYPLLRDAEAAASGRRARHLVLLFHGLNERSFTKYVPWAYQLWRATGAAVALYPLAFHVKRVSPDWGVRMKDFLALRRALPFSAREI